MAKTFQQMVDEAQAAVRSVDVHDAYRRLQEDPRTVLIDVRDYAEQRVTGLAAGAIAVSAAAGSDPADTAVPAAWRDPHLQDRAAPVLTMCELGPISALAAKTLTEMGFADVAYVEGGIQAWREAGLPTMPAPAL